jgi:ubiquinone biosynthesis protein
MVSIFFTHARHQTRVHFYRTRFSSLCCLLLGAIILLGPITQFCPISRAARPRWAQPPRGQVSLPTPRSHYDTFKRGASGLPLLMDLLKEFDPKIQEVLLRFALASGFQGIPSTAQIDSADLKKLKSLAASAGITEATLRSIIPKAEIVALIKQSNWQTYKPILLEFFLHQSQVLEMIPEKWGAVWAPIVHDALLFFLDHLSNDRLLDKLVSLAMLPPGSSRGEYLKEFVSKVPSLQKMGQILARNPDLSPDYQKALQDLENGIHTMTRDELVQFVNEDIGKPSIDKYQVQFADKILAEASVGATIRATMVSPAGTPRRQVICKVVKPYVLAYMPEDLAIVDGLAAYFTTNHDFYELGSLPLVDMFSEIRKALTNEINIVDEQKNFATAREYYKGSNKVVVPEIFPISTTHVTVMDFIAGEKITSAFPGDSRQRSVMAVRLSEVMTGDVIFSPKPVAIFHGDPHPGNVYRLTNDPKNPYKIALLDWGLMGTFPRAERVALMQLILGVQMSDAKRLRKNVGSLIEGGLPSDPAKLQKIDALVAEIVKPKPGRGSFDGLSDLLFGLIEQGYTTNFNLNIFIKSQATIAGELVQLDPTLKQDELLEKQITAQVKKEMPKRLVCVLFCWNSRGYTSLLSNSDVMAVSRYKKPKDTGAAPAPTPAPVKSQP